MIEIPLKPLSGDLGVSYELVRQCAAGANGRPVLPTVKRQGVLCADPWQTFDYLTKHTRCRNLRQPSMPRTGGQIQGPAAPAPGEQDAEEGDLVVMLGGLIHDLKRQAAGGITSDQLRAISQAVQAAERLIERREKAKLKFDADEVVRMLRANAQVWCESVQDHLAPVGAANIVKYIRETFGVDLVAQNVDTVLLLKSIIQATAGETILATQKKLDDLCAGVRDLEFGGPPQ